MSRNIYNDFQNTLYKVLDKHAPVKKKYLRANDSPFMTNHLRKMIMNRYRSKNTYFKNKTVENWERYRKLRNECVKLPKKAYYKNITFLTIKKNLENNKTKFFWQK